MKGAIKQVPVVRDLPEYSLLLALEASGDSVSVAVAGHAGCLAFKQHNARFGHAEYLVDMVQDVMEEADAVFSDLTHIAAGCARIIYRAPRLFVCCQRVFACH